MKKNVKKLKSLLLVFALLFSVTGCTSNTNSSSEISVVTEIVEITAENESTEDNNVTDESVSTDVNSGTSSNLSAASKTESIADNTVNVQSPTKTDKVTSDTVVTQSNISTPNAQINKDPVITESKEELPEEESDERKEVEEENIPPSTSNTQTSSKPSYSIPEFTEKVYEYEYENIKSDGPFNSYYAWMSVYCVGDTDANKENFKIKFKETFGFEPTAVIKVKNVGKYLVDGYQGAKWIYQYTIKDSTYPLITDEFYVVKKKLCSDGSAWCGFAVPCSMDNMDNSQRVQDLKKEMRQTFCDWYGVDYIYVVTNQDKFEINMICELGVVRTEDGRVLSAIYHYMRGINMPVESI